MYQFMGKLKLSPLTLEWKEIQDGYAEYSEKYK